VNKAVNDFKNLFSIIFFLIGGYFLFLGVIHVGIISLVSLLVIVFVNSDWFYSNFDVKHYNFFVAFIVFILILVNSFFIYNEMKYSALFNKVSAYDQKNYIEYENSLFDAIKPCVDKHNQLVVVLNTKKIVDAKDIKEVNLICYRSIENIEKQDVSEALPKEIKTLSQDAKNNFVQIAVNLSSFNYSADNSQEALKKRVVTYYKNVLTDINKIRTTMDIKESTTQPTKNLVKF